MSTFVDPLKKWPRPKGARASYSGAGEWWCHLMADSHAELQQMARRLRLSQSWFQAAPRQCMQHYDLTPGMRKKAVALGAVELTH